MSFTFTGAQGIAAKLRAMGEGVKSESKNVLKKEASSILNDAKANYIPVNTGALRDSGTIDEVQGDNGEYSIRISFTGPQALAIHENPSSHDPKSWQGKNVQFHPAGHGRKYLELPLNKAVGSGMLERFAVITGIKKG